MFWYRRLKRENDLALAALIAEGKISATDARLLVACCKAGTRFPGKKAAA